jgi:hypothetical protein
MNSNKYLITQSLLSSWLYVYKSKDGYKSFIKALNKEPIQPSTAMLDGNRFENLVSAVNKGNPLDPAHEWYDGVMQTASILKDSAEQVKLSKDIIVCGIPFVLYGVLDNLKAGVIYDTKMSKSYHFGKFYDSPQHPMYFKLCPEAYKFTYIVFNGKDVFTETYYPYDTAPIEGYIKSFIKFLNRMNLMNIFKEKWISKY